MPVFDATALLLFLEPDARAPRDPATNEPVTNAKARIDYLIKALEKRRALNICARSQKFAATWLQSTESATHASWRHEDRSPRTSAASTRPSTAVERAGEAEHLWYAIAALVVIGHRDLHRRNVGVRRTGQTDSRRHEDRNLNSPGWGGRAEFRC